MQTCYVVTGSLFHRTFSQKEEAEKYLVKELYDIVGDSRFSVDVLRSFCTHYDFSDANWFEDNLNQLIDLATQKDNTNVEELIKLWNIVFPEDKLQLIVETNEQ